MSDVPPFGFGLPDRDPERREPGGGQNPAGDPFGLGALFGSVAGGGSPEDLLGKMPLFAELQKLMNWSGGPVNWDLARQGAVSQLAAGSQPTSEAERTAVADSLRLADLWLDQVTELPSGIERTAAWSRVEWVELTLPAWGALIDPLAEKVVAAMTSALPQEAAMSFGPDRRDHGPDGRADVRRAGRPGARQARRRGRHQHRRRPAAGPGGDRRPRAAERGRVRRRPRPAGRRGAAVPRPARGGLPAALRPCPVAAPAAPGRGARLRARHHDRPRGDRARASPRRCPAWRGASTRATRRASSSCSAAACWSPRRRRSSRWRCAAWRRCWRWSRAGWTPSSPRRRRTGCPATPALAETMRRRRASGGPAEQTFATLVGLQLRPRRLRDAATVWAAMGQQHGSADRDQPLGAPRPAADLRRPRRADGLRRPSGHGRRARRADGGRRRAPGGLARTPPTSRARARRAE